MSARPRRAVRLLMDAAVFGPLGFALEARHLVPQLAARGRQHVAHQLAGVRALTGLLGGPARPRSASPASAAIGVAVAPSADTTEEIAVRVVDEVADAGRDHDLLPIEGYDALAASQIVARLSGLDEDGLVRVQQYEASHRARRTVLHRIDQLLHTR
jgi:hypothetical protein